MAFGNLTRKNDRKKGVMIKLKVVKDFNISSYNVLCFIFNHNLTMFPIKCKSSRDLINFITTKHIIFPWLTQLIVCLNGNNKKAHEFEAETDQGESV